MRFAALGRTRWLLSSIELVAKHHSPVLIATAPAAPEYGVDESDFASLAARIGAEFFTRGSGTRGTLLQAIQRTKPDVAISVNWPYLLGENVLKAIPHGILNAHPGDLPRFRGNASPNWAILAGERHAALTVHGMTTELDGGPVHARATMPIDDTTYIGDIYSWLATAIPTLMLEAVNAIEKGSSTPVEQSSNPADWLRGFPRVPEDSFIDWTSDAESIGRLVRASAEPFGGAYTFLGGDRLTVWRARPGVLPFRWLGQPGQVANRDASSGEVGVLTGADLIVLQEIEHLGRRGRASDLIRSTRVRLGSGPQKEIELLKARVRALEDNSHHS